MPQYGLTLSTAPTSEPVSLTEAKRQCGIADDISFHDQRLMGLVQAAREKVEADTGRAIVTQTWDYTFDLWPCGLGAIYLPLNPVSSVTHVKYYDTSNVQQTLSTNTYKTLLDREPAEIRLKNAQQWPSLYGETGVISIRFVAGWAVASVPEYLKQAIKLLVQAHFDGEQVNNDRYRDLISHGITGDEFHSYSRSFEYA